MLPPFWPTVYLYFLSGGDEFAGLAVNYGISNTYALDIPQFTTKPAS